MAQEFDAATAAESEWWKQWWDADYSWDELVKKSGNNRKGEPWNLQDYWRQEDENQRLITGPDGRRWTRFHLPLKWQDGSPTEKVSWSQETLEQFREDLLTYLSEACDDEEYALFSGIVAPTFPSAFQLSSLPEKSLKVHARRAWVKLSDSFSQRELEYADFGNTLFEGDTNFSGSRFIRAAWFNDALFLRNAVFRRCEVSCSAIFYGAKFFDEVDFVGCKFKQGGYFQRSNFLKTTHFWDSQFDAVANFTRTLFSGDNNWFNRAVFSGNTIFSHAKFEGESDFSVVTFGGETNFSYVTWPKEIGKFGGAFRDAQFERLVNFESDDFTQFALFDGAHFEGEVRFSSDVLYKDVAFKKALTAAKKKASKEYALWIEEEIKQSIAEKLKQGGEREGLDSSINVGFSADADNAIDLYRNDFAAHRTGVGDNTELGRLNLVSYRGQDDGRPHVSRGQRNEILKKTVDKYFRQLESGARSLKNAAERTRDKLAEQRFYRLELLSRKEHSKTRISEKLLTNSYEFLSSFGTSMVRPIGAILLLIVLSATALLSWHGMLAGSSAPENFSFFDALNFSSQVTFRPFSYWSDNFGGEESLAKSLLFDHGSANRFAVRAYCTLQSFLSIILLFLTALAARRYFELR